ncbi:40S ribosomal protein S6-like [Lynx canadensis]|uniref:40S ribosomal protein S6-like n=1 Tax=Lynx canadensis TaxID=61383 RepID=UPI0013C4E52F|nr:40S ribosomal protein S6-like [Lynx canadensis]
MKLNLCFPATGCQKLIDVDDVCKLLTFSEKRVATEVAANALREEWKGSVVRITGGNDKQGFPTKQGVSTHGRVHLLLSKGPSCSRARRTGERKHTSVPGGTMEANLGVLNLVLVKKVGEGYSWSHWYYLSRHLGSKKAGGIHKPFSLSKEDAATSML